MAPPPEMKKWKAEQLYQAIGLEPLPSILVGYARQSPQ
jgi:hypothetical protein